MHRRGRGELVRRLEYAAGAARATAADPFEGLERTRERVAERRESRHGPWIPAVEPRADQRLHAELGAAWPCETCAGFDDVWRGVLDSLREQRLDVGRGAFGGWDDADRGFARTVWAFARHRRPAAVVETGVARGLTTAVILEALARNGRGRLWSVDLPPLLQARLSDETAAAVPRCARDRWTLLRASSRRVLPALLAGLGEIDLFVHDSMHTTRNVRFELERAWPVLAPGGAALVDDIERNAAFAAFTAGHSDARATACAADDGRAYFGWLVKAAPG